MTASTRCIACGHTVDDPPRLNRLEDGTPCRACRERALDSVPPALPRPAPTEVQGEIYQGELFDDDDGPVAG